MERPPVSAPDVIVRADFMQEFERVHVAAEQNVLPVVHDVTGFTIAKRRRPASEAGARFQHEHPRTVPGQPHRRAQPGAAAADDGDVVAGQRSHNHCFNAISA